MEVLKPFCRKAWIAVLLAGSCSRNPSELKDNFVIDGQVWADGRVTAAPIGQPQILALLASSKAPTSDQAVDNYALVGVLGIAEVNQTRRGIRLLGYHPGEKGQILSFTYRLCLTPRPVAEGQEFDVAMQRIWDQRDVAQSCKTSLIPIGKAARHQGAAVSLLELNKGVNVAEIISGAHAGDWALYVGEMTEIASQPLQYCGGGSRGGGTSQTNPSQGGVNQQSSLPGKLPSKGGAGTPGSGTNQGGGQSPNQVGFCSRFSPSADLCGGNPLAPQCVDSLLAFSSQQSKEQVNPVRGLTAVTGKERLFQVTAALGEEAVINFSSASIAANEENNASQCAELFSAVARTLDNRVHHQCKLSLAPASPKDGKLTCGIAIKIRSGGSLLDRVCEVQSTFAGTADENLSIRVFTSP